MVDGSLPIAVMAVQQRMGATECGVMAIANGYHAICGDDLSKVSYIPEKMREHLSRCMENKVLTVHFQRLFHADKASVMKKKTFKYIDIDDSFECKRLDTYQDMIACDI